MSSAICFNLDQSKILSSGNGLINFSAYQMTKLPHGLVVCPTERILLFLCGDLLLTIRHTDALSSFLLKHGAYYVNRLYKITGGSKYGEQ